MTAPQTPTPTPRPRHRRRTAILATGAILLATATTLAISGVAAASPTTATAPPAPDVACADGPWQVHRAPIEGAPIDFEHGDPGRTYLWHDGTGWHLRTTDVTAAAHHYTGTVIASPGASFVDVAKIRFEPGDHLWADRGVLHYDFTTHAGIDGIDFRVTACNADRDRERLTFDLRRGGASAAALVDLGEHRAHPDSDPFTATR